MQNKKSPKLDFQKFAYTFDELVEPNQEIILQIKLKSKNLYSVGFASMSFTSEVMVMPKFQKIV